MTVTGRVVNFVRDRGYGFLQPTNERSDRVFFHITDIAGKCAPTVGDRFTFEIATDEQSGRPKAVTIRPVMGSW